MASKDTNIPSTYSGHRSISNSNAYEMINYGNHNKNDTTIDSNLKHSYTTKSKERSFKKNEISVLNEDLSGMISHSHYDH